MLLTSAAYLTKLLLCHMIS